MSHEWIDAVAAGAQVLIAGATVYTAYVVYSQRSPPKESDAPAQTKKSLNPIISDAPVKLTTEAGDEDYVAAMMKIVKDASAARSKPFDEYPRTQNIIAAKSMALTFGIATATSLLISIFLGIYLRSAGSFISIAFAIVALSASAAIWWRVFNQRTNKAWRLMYDKVYQAEDKLEEQLTKAVADSRFVPSMALALHDGLLKEFRLTWYPMIFLTDRVIINEFAQRLTTEKP